MTVKSPLDDRRVQALLNKFMSGSIDTLTPIFDLKRGFVYPDVEEIIGESEDAEKFLAMLVEAGILKRELYDKTVYCPKCGSANVSVQYCCPFCLSHDIKKSSLIEHVKCGYMDIEEKFVSGDGLICPKCKSQLTVEDVDYRRAGLWCTCNKCGRSFDIPVPRHFCRNCQTNFTFENAKIKDAYKYRLNEDIVKTAASEWAILAPIRKLLEDKGFKVETPGFMEGRSGVKHMFDIIAYSNGRKPEKMAINISTSPDGKPVPEHAIIDMFAKTYDSNIEKAILIAIPKISENGRKLANHYKISLIEAKTPEETIEKIKETLKQK
jgi:transcription elongation factor Elf1